MKNDKEQIKNASQSQGAELNELVHMLGKNREGGIAELEKTKEVIKEINRTKAALSADKRAGLIFEELHAGSFNAAARKAGDFDTTAITGARGGFGSDPRVDIQVSRGGKVIVEAQAKCCRNADRTAIQISKPKYEGTDRLVPLGQGKEIQEKLIESAKKKATSHNSRMREIGAARQEAAGKVSEQLNAGGHKSQPVSHEESIKMAKGDTSRLSNTIVQETMTSALFNGAKAGAAFSGGISTVTSAYKVATGEMSTTSALKTITVETLKGGTRSAATAVVAEGVKVAAKRSLSKATAGALLRGAGPMAVAGCVVDVVSDACTGELTVRSAAKSVSRAAGGWAGAEGGAALGSLLCPGIGTVIGGLLGGIGGSLLGGFW